jgi:ubiquinone/menaquinone biosynthesis C-methylase UbiE
MSIFHKIKKRLLHNSESERIDVSPAGGYDLWSATYDDEPWNLMVALDEEIFGRLIQDIPLNGKVIVDVGCGTGRHWKRLLAQRPALLTGFDVSQGMLTKLRAKYPDADARLMKGHGLPGLADVSVDVIVSTLAFAHFEDVTATIKEWGRVLKPGGDILLTDAHPVSFSQGADITFGSQSKTYQIAHYIYPLDMLRELAAEYGLEEIAFAERKIDSGMKHFYEAQQALATYQKFKGVPLIYGIHFRKK